MSRRTAVPHRARGGGARSFEAPLLIRVVSGDITAARAGVLVVNHFNGLPPSGAERAVDEALGGAITRAAARGAMQASFGATRFFPASRAPLAAEAVLVISLGEPERFGLRRLPEIGAALIEAMAGSRLCDAATIVHGAGSAGVTSGDAVLALVRGLVDGRATVAGADCIRAVTLVESDPERLGAMATALATFNPSPGFELWIEAKGKTVRRTGGGAALGGTTTRATTRRAPATRGRVRGGATDGGAPHLRLGITRAGPDLKVTVIGEGALDSSAERPYPAELATTLLRRLHDEVLAADSARGRREAMLGIGEQLRRAFLDPARFDVADLLGDRRRPLVLRLDRATVELPWELLCHEGRFVAQTAIVSRQIESGVVGRTAPAITATDGDDDGRLRVLVVGDPTGDLPSARKEAEDVVRVLGRLRRARVEALVGGVPYTALSRALDSTRFDVIHYAGHARFDPMRGTALVLADAEITGEDLATRRYLPRLFFGNACHSARTDEETEILVGTLPTLVTGLLSAGVRAFIGAQWQVDDRAAKTFATSFYRALLEGRAVGESTRAARTAVVSAHGSAEPAWAAYVLYGPPWLSVL